MRALVFYILISGLCINSWAVPFEGQKMLISAPSPYAVEAGKKIIQQGGNVVDVAVAVALAMSVTVPYFAALGGGGFAMVKIDGHSTLALDFRETAPYKTHPQYFVELKEKNSANSSTVGGSAVGVPGIPLGLFELHKKYGKLTWKSLFSDAIELANKGFYVSGEWINRTETSQSFFTETTKKYFLNNGRMFTVGDTHKQKNLSKTIIKLRNYGPKGFYEGEVAQDIVTSVKKAGGVMELDDLKKYKVRWLQPLIHENNNHKIYLMPPPSSGGLVIKTALSLIEKHKPQEMTNLSVEEFHLIAEILQRSFRGRALLGDPDFYINPIEYLTSTKYLKELSESIKQSRTSTLPPLEASLVNSKPYKEKTETTHFSVLDSKGNGVAITLTLNGNYGSGVTSEKFGIALNNEMDDFTTLPGQPNMYGLIQGEGNYVQPGKRPLSSMSPTLVTKKMPIKNEKSEKVVLTLGAPGGPTIISGVLQVLYRNIYRAKDLDLSIQTPRVHHQFLPNVLYIDAERFQDATKVGLIKKGHKLEERNFIGRINAVSLKDSGTLEAAFDSRGEGSVGGY